MNNPSSNYTNLIASLKQFSSNLSEGVDSFDSLLEEEKYQLSKLLGNIGNNISYVRGYLDSKVKNKFILGDKESKVLCIKEGSEIIIRILDDLKNTNPSKDKIKQVGEGDVK